MGLCSESYAQWNREIKNDWTVQIKSDLDDFGIFKTDIPIERVKNLRIIARICEENYEEI